MSLVVEVKINSQVLRTVVVTRQNWEQQPVNDYQVMVYDHEAHTEKVVGPLLRHASSDGAMALARRALMQVEEES